MVFYIPALSSRSKVTAVTNEPFPSPLAKGCQTCYYISPNETGKSLAVATTWPPNDSVAAICEKLLLNQRLKGEIDFTSLKSSDEVKTEIKRVFTNTDSLSYRYNDGRISFEYFPTNPLQRASTDASSPSDWPLGSCVSQ